jgi:SagB-type dehydrogenase family enzyme
MQGTGKQFMEMTKYQNMKEAPQRKGVGQPPLEVPVKPGAALIALPNPADAPASKEPLLTIINQRRSLRSYSQTPLTLEELSYLLWCSQGVQKAFSGHTLRTVPSAGARHALETYVLVNLTEGLQAGLYRYSALNAALEPVDLSKGIADRLMAACLGQGMVGSSAVTIFWTAELERMYFRYGERGYRYLHLDAGHACQNLCLAAEATGCGACAIAAFDDDALNDALGLDGENRFAVYVASLGKKPE